MTEQSESVESFSMDILDHVGPVSIISPSAKNIVLMGPESGSGLNITEHH